MRSRVFRYTSGQRPTSPDARRIPTHQPHTIQVQAVHLRTRPAVRAISTDCSYLTRLPFTPAFGAYGTARPSAPPRSCPAQPSAGVTSSACRAWSPAWSGPPATKHPHGTTVTGQAHASGPVQGGCSGCGHGHGPCGLQRSRSRGEWRAVTRRSPRVVFAGAKRGPGHGCVPARRSEERGRTKRHEGEALLDHVSGCPCRSEGRRPPWPARKAGVFRVSVFGSPARPAHSAL
jgi:hypothetical protein